jgi:hypothetical protein
VGASASGCAQGQGLFQRIGNGLDVGRQGGKISGLGFHQQGRGGGGDAFNHGRHAGFALNTAQGGPVHQFGRGHGQGLHAVGRLAGPSIRGNIIRAVALKGGEVTVR